MHCVPPTRVLMWLQILAPLKKGDAAACASTVTGTDGDASLRYLILVWTDHYGPAHAARAFYLPPEVAAEWLTSRSNESNTRAKKRGSGFKAAFG